MGNFAIQTYFFGTLFYRGKRNRVENRLLMVAVAIFAEGLYPNVTVALWNYIVIPNQVILNIFMLSCLNVLDVTSKCLEPFYTMLMCSNVEKVMSLCKDVKKMACLHTNPLNFTPSHFQKEKTPEYSEYVFLI